MSSVVPGCLRVVGAESNICGSCTFATECESQEKYTLQFSIAEQAASLRRDSDVDDLGDKTDSIAEIFEAEHERIFGARPRNWQTTATSVMLGRLLAKLLLENISPALWITANMHQLQKWAITNPHIGFKPNMLCGEKARGRYNAYLRAAKRRTNHASEQALNQRTSLTKFRAEVYCTELSIAQIYVETTVSEGQAVPWNTVVKFVGGSENWEALSTLRGARFLELRKQHGDAWVRRESEIMHLDAAVAVLSQFGHELPHRVGYSKFSWPSLANLVKLYIADVTKGRRNSGQRIEIQ